MGSIRITLMTILALCLSVSALATDPVSVRANMSAGDFQTAQIEAKAIGTPEGYALAAESMLSEIMLGQVEKNKKHAKRARKLAEAALELEPSSQNARLQYAIADGFITRETGNVSAWMKKLPQKTHAIIQAYRNDFPDDPRGDALLGAWNLAIARKTGDEDAQKWFGANIAEGRECFLVARQGQPSDPVIGVNYAFALIALKDDDLGNTDEARSILEEMVTLTPADYLGHTLQDYAREALLRLDDRDAARKYAGLFLDGKRPE